MYVNPRPTKKEMGKFYPRNYYGKQERTVEVVVKLLHLMKIKKIMSFKKNGRILDVGCGDGEFLRYFKERGWEAYGVDVSETSCMLARRKLGQNIFNCELKDCRFPPNYFDVITLNHVLEHMLDPNEELIELRRILKNNGILFLSVPNIDSLQFKISEKYWLHLDLPRHVYHYSPASIKNLLERDKFEIIKLTFPLFDSPLDMYYSLKDRFSSGYQKFRKILSPFFLIASSIKIIPQWRGTMEIFARKL
jgi:2-polyprenyl-3-methyl-5-hydroxy-6-metoxy-1,4-benzoquinol methylase